MVRGHFSVKFLAVVRGGAQGAPELIEWVAKRKWQALITPCTAGDKSSARSAGVAIGEEVGFAVRGDNKTTSATRIRYTTEGLGANEHLGARR